MSVEAGVHRAHQADVVDDARDVGQQLGDLRTALTVLLELPRAAHERLAGAIHKTELHVAAVLLAAALRELGLGIGQVHVRGATVHEHGNHGPRLRRELRRLGPRVEGMRWRRFGCGRREQIVLRQQRSQRHAPHAHGIAGKILSAGDWVVRGHVIQRTETHSN